jgi:hypothetical protein
MKSNIALPLISLLCIPLTTSSFQAHLSLNALSSVPSVNDFDNRIFRVAQINAFKDGVDRKAFFVSPSVNGKDYNGINSDPNSFDDSEGSEATPAVEKEEQKKKQNGKILFLSTRKAVLFGMLLASISGFVNGACLSGFWSNSQATAAVTGSWTNSALSLAGEKTGLFLLHSKYILSFIGGSTLGGLFVPRPVPFEINNPKGVAFGFGFSSVFLFAAALLGNTSRIVGANFLCLCLAANGIQNSLTSSLTSNLCRTTHFSGISSDIGTFLGQCLRGNRENSQKLKVFPLLGLSFWTGGFASYPLTKSFASRSLLVASIVYGIIAISLGFHAFRYRSSLQS